MTFSDEFSVYAARYKAYRPTYPDALFTYLASLVPFRDLAWDCATGNGQAAIGLASRFQYVLATDASPEQIAEASPHRQVGYLVSRAEQTPLRDSSVDLVAVASAFHWLDHERFYAEVRRVAKPGGILAAWGYKMPMVSPEVEAVVRRFDTEVLEGFWLPADKARRGRLPVDPVPLRRDRDAAVSDDAHLGL